MNYVKRNKTGFVSRKTTLPKQRRADNNAIVYAGKA